MQRRFSGLPDICPKWVVIERRNIGRFIRDKTDRLIPVDFKFGAPSARVVG